MPRGKYKLTPDPSPEEIREACLQIQESWSPEEREQRRQGKQRDDRMGRQEIRSGGMAYTIPTVRLMFDLDRDFPVF